MNVWMVYKDGWIGGTCMLLEREHGCHFFFCFIGLTHFASDTTELSKSYLKLGSKL